MALAQPSLAQPSLVQPSPEGAGGPARLVQVLGFGAHVEGALERERGGPPPSLPSLPPLPLAAPAGSDLVKAMTNVAGEEGFVFGDTAQSLLVRRGIGGGAAAGRTGAACCCTRVAGRGARRCSLPAREPVPCRPPLVAPFPATPLQAVDIPFAQYFTPSTKEAYQGITSLDTLAAAGAAAGASSSSGGESSGVSSGAAAGIGVGCAVAGALLGALAMALYAKKKRGSWSPHLDERPLDSAREPSNGFKI